MLFLGDHNIASFNKKLTLGKVQIPYILKSAKNKKYIKPNTYKVVKKLDDDVWDMGSQTVSSANTSRSQISSGNKRITWDKNTVNLDIGGGRIDKNTNFLKEKGVDNQVYDPFNKTETENKKALRKVFRYGGADTVTNHNVLNVIPDEKDREKVLKQLKQSLSRKGKGYVSVYEGVKNNVGKQTRDGWQNNRKLKGYLEEVKKVFPNAQIENNLIKVDKRK